MAQALISPSLSGDVESVVNQLTQDLALNSTEEKKISKSRVIVNTDRTKSKREEYIENLKKQMNQTTQNGGCFKFIRTVFKVCDFVLKPLTAISMGQFKVQLMKTLDMLKDTKNQQAMMQLQTKSQEIMKVIESIKNLLTDDTKRLEGLNDHTQKESGRIQQILNEIEESFSHINKKV